MVIILFIGILFVFGVVWYVVFLFIIIGIVIGVSVLVFVGNMGMWIGLLMMGFIKGVFGLCGVYVIFMVNVIILMGWSWV